MKKIMFPLWVKNQAFKYAREKCRLAGLKEPSNFNPDNIERFIRNGIKDDKYISQFNNHVFDYCNESLTHSHLPSDIEGANPWTPPIPDTVYGVVEYFFGPKNIFSDIKISGDQLELFGKAGLPKSEKEAKQQFKSAVTSLCNLFVYVRFQKDKAAFSHESKKKMAEKLGRAPSEKELLENDAGAVVSQYQRYFSYVVLANLLIGFFEITDTEIREYMNVSGLLSDKTQAEKMSEVLSKMHNPKMRANFAKILDNIIEPKIRSLELGDYLIEQLKRIKG